MLVTIQDLQDKLTHLQEFYAQRNANFLAWRNLYFMRPEAIFTDKDGEFIEPEPDEERIIWPIPYNVVEGFRELLLTKSPAISVPASTAAGKSLLAAEHNEKALLALWDRAGIYDRLRDSLWHGLVDGWGVLQLVWDSAAKDEESPIQILHHDPYNVYAMPASQPGEWKYIIHAYPQLIGEIKDEWMPVAGKDNMRYKKNKVAAAAFLDMKDTDSVTFIDYWDDEVNAVAISYQTTEGGRGDTRLETTWIKEPTSHGYGFLPWEIYLPCQLPFRNVGERMGVGVLYVLEALIVYIDKLSSAKATFLSRWEDPPLITHTDLGPDFEPVRAEKGMHLRLRLDEKAEYLVHPGPMPQIDTMLGMTQEYIEMSSLPRVLQGMYVGSISGIAMSLLRNPTLMKIAFRQKSIERAMRRLNVKMLKLLEEKLTAPRYMWGTEISGQDLDVMVDPDKIAGYYRNQVKLSASLPTDDANMVNMLASLVQLKIISRQTARDVAQQTLHDLVPQSLTEEETRILAELIWQDPGIIQSLAMGAAEEVSLPYLSKQENPKGGYGERQERMPAGTVASQAPGMPGGNVNPSDAQRLQAMMQAAQGQQRREEGVAR